MSQCPNTPSPNLQSCIQSCTSYHIATQGLLDTQISKTEVTLQRLVTTIVPASLCIRCSAASLMPCDKRKPDTSELINNTIFLQTLLYQQILYGCHNYQLSVPWNPWGWSLREYFPRVGPVGDSLRPTRFASLRPTASLRPNTHHLHRTNSHH